MARAEYYNPPIPYYPLRQRLYAYPATEEDFTFQQQTCTSMTSQTSMHSYADSNHTREVFDTVEWNKSKIVLGDFKTSRAGRSGCRVNFINEGVILKPHFNVRDNEMYVVKQGIVPNMGMFEEKEGGGWAYRTERPAFNGFEEAGWKLELNTRVGSILHSFVHTVESDLLDVLAGARKIPRKNLSVESALSVYGDKMSHASFTPKVSRDTAVLVDSQFMSMEELNEYPLICSTVIPKLVLKPGYVQCYPGTSDKDMRVKVFWDVYFFSVGEPRIKKEPLSEEERKVKRLVKMEEELLPLIQDEVVSSDTEGIDHPQSEKKRPSSPPAQEEAHRLSKRSK